MLSKQQNVDSPFIGVIVQQGTSVKKNMAGVSLLGGEVNLTSKPRSWKVATKVKTEVGTGSELGLDVRYDDPLLLLKADRDIEAFYGYCVSTKKYCVSHEGCGAIGEYTWYERSELRGVNPKWLRICILQGLPKKLKTLDIPRYRPLAGDDARDLRCLLTALSAACPELTGRLSMMDPVPLAHLERMSRDESWPVMISQTVFAPQLVQAGDYLICKSPSHCEFMHFDGTTPLSDVYMCARVVRRDKAKTEAKAAKKQRQRDLKRQKI